MASKRRWIVFFLAVYVSFCVAVPTAFSFALSGVVLAPDGLPLHGASVELLSAEDDVSFVAKSTTNPAGAFFFSAAAGFYRLRISTTLDGVSVAVPLHPAQRNEMGRFRVVSDTVLPDLVLPLVTLTGKVLDSFGAPVAGAAVALGNGVWDEAGAFYACGGKAYTDSSGTYSMSLYPYRGYRVTISPPKSEPFVPFTIIDFDASLATQRNFIFPQVVTSQIAAGQEVEVRPLPNIRMVFDSVTRGGSLSAHVAPAPPPPENSRFPEDVSYQMSSTALFRGQVEVCLSYDESSLVNRTHESNLKLSHHDGQAWDDITTHVDAAGNVICGVTNPFAPLTNQWSSL